MAPWLRWIRQCYCCVEIVQNVSKIWRFVFKSLVTKNQLPSNRYVTQRSPDTQLNESFVRWSLTLLRFGVQITRWRRCMSTCIIALYFRVHDGVSSIVITLWCAPGMKIGVIRSRLWAWFNVGIDNIMFGSVDWVGWRWWHRWSRQLCSPLFQFLSTTISYTPLTLSTPAVPNCCCSKGPAPYWSNPPFLIFDIRALWRSVLSARAPECQKLKMVG